MDLDWSDLKDLGFILVASSQLNMYCETDPIHDSIIIYFHNFPSCRLQMGGKMQTADCRIFN